MLADSGFVCLSLFLRPRASAERGPANNLFEHFVRAAVSLLFPFAGVKNMRGKRVKRFFPLVLG